MAWRMPHFDLIASASPGYVVLTINGCIIMTYHWKKDIMVLDDYYRSTPKSACPLLPHSEFFDFLKDLSRRLNCRTIKTVDGSNKEFPPCDAIPSCIFSLAGYQTFYEHFGFESAKYHTEVERLKKVKIKNHEMPIDGDVFKGTPLSTRSTFEEVALYIVRKCKENTGDPFIINPILQEIGSPIDMYTFSITLGRSTRSSSRKKKKTSVA